MICALDALYKFACRHKVMLQSSLDVWDQIFGKHIRVVLDRMVESVKGRAQLHEGAPRGDIGEGSIEYRA